MCHLIKFVYWNAAAFGSYYEDWKMFFYGLLLFSEGVQHSYDKQWCCNYWNNSHHTSYTTNSHWWIAIQRGKYTYLSSTVQYVPVSDVLLL